MPYNIYNMSSFNLNIGPQSAIEFLGSRSHPSDNYKINKLYIFYTSSFNLNIVPQSEIEFLGSRSHFQVD